MSGKADDSSLIEAYAASDDDGVTISRRIRHDLFCMGGAGEALEICRAQSPDGPHDDYDHHSLSFWGTINGQPVSTARLILGPDLQSAAMLKGLGSEFARLLPPGYQRGLYRAFAWLHLPVKSLLLHWWLRRWAEPSRLGLAKEYQMSPAGRRLILRHLGQMTLAALTRGIDECLITMRPGVFGIISFMPLRLGPLFAYPASAGGPTSNDPIRAVSVNFHEVVAAVEYHSNPEMRRLMFGDDDVYSLVDRSKVRPRKILKAEAQVSHKRHSLEFRAWRTGKLLLPTVG